MYDSAARSVTMYASDLAPLLVSAQALTSLWAGVSPATYQDRHRSGRYRPEVVAPALHGLLAAVQAVYNCPADNDERWDAADKVLHACRDAVDGWASMYGSADRRDEAAAIVRHLLTPAQVLDLLHAPLSPAGTRSDGLVWLVKALRDAPVTP